MGRGIILVSKISDVDSRERPFRTRRRQSHLCFKMFQCHIWEPNVSELL